MAHPGGREISDEIIEGCRKGDRNAFRVLYDIYKDKVYSIALYFFHGNVATASDVTQQVFLKLMTDFQHFRGDSAFSTWLYRLVVNTCIDTERRGKRHPAQIDQTLLETIAAEGSHEQDLAQRQIASSIRDAISSLPQKFRLAILLRYFEDLSYQEMASALNCSMGTVSSRLSRGHKLLAGKLEPIREWLGKGQK
ncbi:MAG TPA: sigma-70 family RNA polymerase sigma factor [Bryobacteraceae bacterium]|nr:sigma-70 family RNA polymerase sigma factor [Bryobacteraceae bacterium]